MQLVFEVLVEKNVNNNMQHFQCYVSCLYASDQNSTLKFIHRSFLIIQKKLKNLEIT
jgi:hypothetical protein